MRVFLSYAREDLSLGDAIATALRQRGIDVLWDSLLSPPLDYAEQIREMIRAADSFAVLLTPYSVASSECGAEMAYAIAHGKRLLPVLGHTDVSAQSLPSEIRTAQWCLCTTREAIDSAVTQMQAALQINIDLVPMHTRLLNRVEEWQARDREKGTLLRDPFLREAEDWLMRAAMAEQRPQPTDLQREYLSASRVAELLYSRTVRRRVVAGIALLISGLLMMALLYVQADRSAKEANHQREIAEQNAAGQARERERAEANAKKADVNAKDADVQRTIAQGQTVLAQTNEALAIQRNRTLLEERGRLDLVENRWDSAAVLLAEAYRLGSDSPALRMMLANALRPMAGAQVMLPGGASVITSTGFSADGSRVILGEVDGTATVWDSRTGKLVATLSPHEGPIEETHLNMDGSRAVVVFTKTNQDFAENGHYRTYALPVYVWDVARAAVYEQHDVGDWDTYHAKVPFVDVRDGGHRFALPGPNKTFREFDFGGGNATPSTADGSMTLMSGPAGGMLVVRSDVRSGALLASTRLDDARIAFRGTSSDVVAVAPSGRVQRIFAKDNSVASVAPVPVGTRLLLSSDGQNAVVLGNNGATVVDLNSGKVMDSWETAIDARYSPNGQFVLGWSKVQSLRFDFWSRGTLPFKSGLRVTAAANNDQAIAAVSNFGAVTFADPKVVQIWWQDGPDGKSKEGNLWFGTPRAPTHVEFSPDGRLLATASEDGSILLKWVTGAGARDRLHADTNVISDLEFSDDSRQLAAASADGTVRIWDITAGEVVATCRGHQDGVSSVRFSADHRFLATGGGDGTARVWELPSCRELLRFPDHDGAPQVLFDASVTRLATADRKFVRVWELAQEDRGPQVVADLVKRLSPACLAESVSGRWTRPSKGGTRGHCAAK